MYILCDYFVFCVIIWIMILNMDLIANIEPHCDISMSSICGAYILKHRIYSLWIDIYILSMCLYLHTYILCTCTYMHISLSIHTCIDFCSMQAWVFFAWPHYVDLEISQCSSMPPPIHNIIISDKFIDFYIFYIFRWPHYNSQHCTIVVSRWVVGLKPVSLVYFL